MLMMDRRFHSGNVCTVAQLQFLHLPEKEQAVFARSRAAAEYCARTLGWKRIECTEPVAPDSEERRMRTIESINDEILKELETVL